MVEFGEEVIIESLRIPWLIWIQLLVFFLLIFLLYCFTSDNLSSDSSSLISSSSSSPNQLPVLHLHQVGDNQHMSTKGGIAAAEDMSSDSGIRGRGILKKKDESSSSSSSLEMEDGPNKTTYHNVHHPCNIVRLAKTAFLKCLGLDSLDSPPSTSPNQTR